MYNLPYFKEKDPRKVKAFIDTNPFAFLSGCDAGNCPVATQVPVFIEEDNGRQFLRGHIMKHTDHHKAFVHNPNVLVVFAGHHTYVSATWYTDPHQASTWNYMSVHVKGIIRFLDEEALADVLRKTSMHFEHYNPHSSTTFDNLPHDYKEKLMKAIVPFEVEILQMDNVFKLSQNRDKESYDNIINELHKGDSEARHVAEAMEENRPSVSFENE